MHEATGQTSEQPTAAGERMSRPVRLSVAGLFVFLGLFVWLIELLDIPHLMLGLPPTPFNWGEALLETILIAAVGVLVVVRLHRDQRQRQQVEEMLRRTGRQWEDIFQAISHPTVILDSQRRVLAANQALVKATGRPEQDLLGLKCYQIFHGPGTGEPPPGCPFEEMLTTGKIGTIEMEMEALDGTFLVSCTPVLDETGRLDRVIHIATDITGRVRAEAEVQRYAARLETLRTVGLELAAQLDLETLLHSIVARAIELLNAAAGGLYLYRPERDVLEWATIVGCDLPPVGTVLHRGEGLSGKVWLTDQPLVVDDYRTWEGRAAIYAGRHWTAVVGVPVRWGDEFLGVLNVLAEPPRTFTPADVDLLSLFAVQAAIAIRNARILAAEEQARRQAEALAQVTAALTSTLELEPLLENLLAAACQVIPAAEKGSILLLDEQTGELCVRATTGYQDPRVRAMRFPTGTGYAFQAVLEKQPLLIPDVQATGYRYGEIEEVQSVQSAIVAPLRYRDRIIGAISLDNASRPMAFTEADRGLLLAFADQAAVAVENARLYEQAQHQLYSLTELNRASQAITSSLEVNEILQQIIGLAGSVVNADYTSVVLLDETGEPVLGAEDLRGVPSIMRRIRPGGVTRHVLATGQPLLVDEIAPDGTIHPPHPVPANPDIVAAGIRSFAAVPIRTKDQVLGVLFVHSRQPRAFHGQLELLTTFANQAAVALENARLYQAERQARQQAEALRQAAQAVSASLELNEILRLILAQLKRVLVYDTASVLMFREDSAPDLVVGVGYADGQMTYREAGKLLRDSPILRRMAQDLEPVVSADVRHLDGWIWVPGAEHVRSWLAVPLVVRGRMIGVLMVDSAKTNAFGPAELQIAQALAQHAAQALENARLYEIARQELTERKQAEKALRENERFLQNVFQAIQDGISILGPDLVILRVNQWMERMYADQAPLVGKKCYEVYQQRSTPCPWCPSIRTIETGKVHTEVVPYPSAVAPTGWIELSAFPLQDAQGHVAGIIEYVKDITDRKRAEEQLRQQERLAAVGQLAAGIAHDFNNILTGMIGFAQLLQIRADVPPSAKTDLGRIVQEGRRAAHLIRQILDFSRKSIRMPQPLDLAEFLEEAGRFLRRTIPERTRILLEIAPGAYPVLADPTQLQQMLTNLAVNAHDAMPEGGELRLSLTRLTLPPDTPPPISDMPPDREAWAVLAVHDTGTGMPPEVMVHLFEPFFTTKEVGRGTGLGLAQVYGIVRQHEGVIRVESQVGRGSTFYIYLPLTHVEGARTAPETPASPIPTGQGETILLVEDEPLVLETLRAMLEQLGYRVLTATNGQEALAVYSQHRPAIALVLADLVMPTMDGAALFRALQAQDPHVKLVVTSGYPLGEEYQQLMAQGIAGWLQKPPDQAHLAQVLRAALQDRRPATRDG